MAPPGGLLIFADGYGRSGDVVVVSTQLEAYPGRAASLKIDRTGSL